MASTQADALNALQAEHRLPGLAEITEGKGGLPRILITSPAASGEIYLHGAHITSWRPAGAEEVIFLSQNSRWAAGEAIRGGVPVCSPWFRVKEDNPKAPKHGLVRTKTWSLEAMEATADGVRVTLATTNDAEGMQWWPFEFTLRLKATFGSSLRMELEYANQSSKPVTVGEALHSYLAVGDIRQISVSGLDGARYFDNMDGNREKRQKGELRFTKGTDNAYMETAAELVLHDPVLRRRIHVIKSGSRSTVAWNPGEEGARRMGDLGDDEWRQFACIEASNVLGCSATVAPGETHTLAAELACERLQN